MVCSFSRVVRSKFFKKALIAVTIKEKIAEMIFIQIPSAKITEKIPAVVNGAIVLLDSSSALSASSTPSPLSIPATIDEYLSVLQEAAEKVNEN